MRYLAIIALASALAFAAVGQHSVMLTWNEADTNVVSYNIYRGSTAGVCAGNPAPYASSTTKSYVDFAVTAGATYYYAVSALNSAGGESACSNEVSALIPQGPQAPTNLVVVAK